MLLLLLLAEALALTSSAPTQALRETRLAAEPTKRVESQKPSSSGAKPKQPTAKASQAKTPQTSVGEPAVPPAEVAEAVSAVDLAEKDITKNVVADKVVIVGETTPEFDRQENQYAGKDEAAVEPYLKKQRAQSPPEAQEIPVYVPDDPTTCVSISPQTTDSWCKDNCAAGSCTLEICECDGGASNNATLKNDTKAKAKEPAEAKPKTVARISVSRSTFAQTAKDLGVPDEVAEALWTKLGDSAADPMIGVATATIIEPANPQLANPEKEAKNKPGKKEKLDAKIAESALKAETKVVLKPPSPKDLKAAKESPRPQQQQQQAALIANVSNSSLGLTNPDEDSSNSSGSGYRGCYMDDVKTPDEAGRFYGEVVGRGLTLEECQSKCIERNNDYTYFAVQHHMVCRCGSQAPDGSAPYQRVADEECDMNKGPGELCQGLAAPEKRGVGGTCGGKGRNSVYKILKSAVRAVKRAKKRAAKTEDEGGL
jgi:hypothetical protein